MDVRLDVLFWLLPRMLCIWLQWFRGMTEEKLDEVDKGIIYLLQLDARNHSPADMAERLPVSEGTVRNRIAKLEENGILTGYIPQVDFEAAGLPLKVIYSCHAPIPERQELAEAALEVAGTLSIREMMTGVHNVRVLAVARDTEEMVRVARDLSDLGLTVELEELLRHEYVQPFDHFGTDVVEGA